MRDAHILLACAALVAISAGCDVEDGVPERDSGPLRSLDGGAGADSGVAADAAAGGGDSSAGSTGADSSAGSGGTDSGAGSGGNGGALPSCDSATFAQVDDSPTCRGLGSTGGACNSGNLSGCPPYDQLMQRAPYFPVFIYCGPSMPDGEGVCSDANYAAMVEHLPAIDACPRPPLCVDGAVLGCDEIVAACASDAEASGPVPDAATSWLDAAASAPLDGARCHAYFDIFSYDARVEIAGCWGARLGAGEDCRRAFFECAFAP